MAVESTPGSQRTIAHLRGLVFVAAAAGLQASACRDTEGPSIEEAAELLGDAYCKRLFTCPCNVSNRPFSSELTCRVEIDRRIDAMRTVAQQAGLTYDASCFRSMLAELDETGCAAQAPASDDASCQPPCTPYHGDLGIGELCKVVDAAVTGCAQGLLCNSGKCFDPCQGRETPGLEGESCVLRGCAEGLFCRDEVCQRLGDVGDPCETLECEPQAFCDRTDPNDPLTWLCAARRELGSPCTGHAQCLSLHCPAGVCAAVPTEGEPCPASICEPGLVCVEEVCEPGDAAICHIEADDLLEPGR